MSTRRPGGDSESLVCIVGYFPSIDCFASESGRFRSVTRLMIPSVTSSGRRSGNSGCSIVKPLIPPSSSFPRESLSSRRFAVALAPSRSSSPTPILIFGFPVASDASGLAPQLDIPPMMRLVGPHKGGTGQISGLASVSLPFPSRLLTGDASRHLAVWDIDTPLSGDREEDDDSRLLFTMSNAECPSTFRCMEFSLRWRVLYVGGTAGYLGKYLVGQSSLEVERCFCPSHESAPSVVAVDCCERLRMVVSAGLEKKVRLWDAESGEDIGYVPVDSSLVSAVKCDDASTHLLVGCYNSAVEVWDLRKSERLPIRRTHLMSSGGMGNEIGDIDSVDDVSCLCASRTQNFMQWNWAKGKVTARGTASSSCESVCMLGNCHWIRLARIGEAGYAEELLGKGHKFAWGEVEIVTGIRLGWLRIEWMDGVIVLRKSILLEV